MEHGLCDRSLACNVLDVMPNNGECYFLKGEGEERLLLRVGRVGEGEGYFSEGRGQIH